MFMRDAINLAPPSTLFNHHPRRNCFLSSALADRFRKSKVVFVARCVCVCVSVCVCVCIFCYRPAFSCIMHRARLRLEAFCVWPFRQAVLCHWTDCAEMGVMTVEEDRCRAESSEEGCRVEFSTCYIQDSTVTSCTALHCTTTRQSDYLLSFAHCVWSATPYSTIWQSQYMYVRCCCG